MTIFPPGLQTRIISEATRSGRGANIEPIRSWQQQKMLPRRTNPPLGRREYFGRGSDATFTDGGYRLRVKGGKEYLVTRTHKHNLKDLAQLWVGSERLCG
jgi:hypothetical protein